MAGTGEAEGQGRTLDLGAWPEGCYGAAASAAPWAMEPFSAATANAFRPHVARHLDPIGPRVVCPVCPARPARWPGPRVPPVDLELEMERRSGPPVVLGGCVAHPDTDPVS